MSNTPADLVNRLGAFINDEISTAADPVSSTTDLLLTGAVDSLGVVRITQWLEDNYGTEVDPLDVTLENFQTIDRMVAFVAAKQADQTE